MRTLQSLKRYITNTLWVSADRLIFMAASFGLAVVLARYLGPERFGIYSYALSLSALFVVAGRLGLGGLVIREIVKRPAEREVVLGTSLLLTIFGMLGAYALLTIYGLWFEGWGSLEFTALVIAGFVLLLKPANIIEFWFQAFVQAKYISMANMFALLSAVVLKLGLVAGGFGLLYLLLANLTQSLLAAAGLLYFYRKYTDVSVWSWRFSWEYARKLLSQSWYIYLGSLFAIVYLKIDQVMIRWLMDLEAVGVYSVAAQLSEAWYFIPSAIVASLFPKLIEIKERDPVQFKLRLQQVFDVLCLMALGLAIVITLTAPWLIQLFFGESYSGSASVLIIHIWASVFIFMRAAFSKWILIENVLVFSLITQGLGAALNVILNVILIPKMGIEGAAYATLLSYMMASFISLVFFSRTRPIFYMMCKSLFLISPYQLLRSRL